jgi:hypothetical protein
MKKILPAVVLLLICAAVAPSAVHAEDCAIPDITGAVTLNPTASGCTFAPTVEGPQNGNLILAAGKTLTVGAGQKIMWNEGYKIDLSNSDTHIIITDGGSLVQGDICLLDTDSDTYPDQTARSYQTPGPCTGLYKARKDPAFHPTLQDCNASDPATNITTTCYPDADADGHYSTTGNAASCVVSCALSGMSATPGDDCNDTGTNAANVWVSATCYTDGDNDNYGTGTAKTCTNNATCASATWASLGEGTTASSGDFSANSTDCNDASASTWVNLSCYTDVDGDTYTTGVAGNVCSGAACPAGYSGTTSGTDCNDTGTSSGNVYISATCYVDGDNDDYGSATSKSCTNNATCASATWASGGAGTAAASGNFSAVSTDCCDTEVNAFPGSTYYGTVATNGCAGSGGYDYDCDTNSSDQLYTTVGSATTCTQSGGVCATVASGVVGWITSVPACGLGGSGWIDSAGTCANSVYASLCPLPTDYTSTTNTQACK